MISNIGFFRNDNHQLANRQFLIASKESNLVDTVYGVKNNGNIEQIIKLPYYPSLETTNYCKIDGLYYDIVDRDNTTENERSVKIHILFNPILTYIDNGDIISGLFDRTPEKTNRAAHVSMGDDMLRRSRKQDLHIMPNFYSQGTGDSYRNYYVQISAKKDLVTGDASSICQYGMFVPIDPYFMTESGWSAYSAQTSPPLNYPSMYFLMNFFNEATDLPSNSIIDVSISPRCPFRYDTITLGGRILKRDGSPVGVHTGADITLGRTLALINKQNTDINPVQNTNVDLVLSDYERYCGKISLVDELNNVVATIPNEYFDANNTLNYSVVSIPDITGLYTRVFIGPNKDMIVTFPEGHLPWIGEAWQDYISQNLVYDRQALANSVRDVDNALMVEQTSAVTNGLTTAVIGAAVGAGVGGVVAGGVSTGLSLWTNQQSADNRKTSLYANLANKEGLIRNSPSTFYQTGYGLDYIFQSYKNGGAHFRIETPANLTVGNFNDYIAHNGWPCGIYQSALVVHPGYIKGNIYSMNNNPSDQTRLNALRREIAIGAKLVGG